ncbi:hypothetical protein SapgrDRAFT_0414 [Saprospira grandis DSM 2844]|uniref:Periplasmic heavy metal sensor n=1 Tax=Saprospira grandis DSM 2844 TaxID=694433 RepID=J1I0J0_9BACT|nr:hypothetical protein [Saprospira grandis]EJF52160.1 hypothetical protein SapgrDRAFT_0414 [Saprospira grandis DSM 2844]
MKQLQFYKYLSLGLLLLNISLITLFLFFSPPPPKGPPRLEDTTQELNLSNEQEQAFILLVNEHLQQMQKVHLQEHDLVMRYFSPLVSQNKVSNQQTIIQDIESLQSQKVVVTYEHFEKVEALLHEEQKKSFKRWLAHTLKAILLEK